jgi:sorting nexin-27
MDDSSLDVTIRILLSEDNTLQIAIKRYSDTRQVHARVVETLKLTADAAHYCSLFEMVDTNFERKLSSRECPHNIYTQNYSSAASSCLLLRKWCFNVNLEKVIIFNRAFLNNLFLGAL